MRPLVVLLAVVWLSQVARADGDLTNVRSLYVDVEGLTEPAKLANLTRVSLETLVDGKLKQSGIPVRQKGETGLQIIVNALETQAHSIVFGCSVSLLEMARPTSLAINSYSDPNLSSTWTRSRLGVSPKKRFAEDARACIADLVDKFLAEYRQANPKKIPNPVPRE